LLEWIFTNRPTSIEEFKSRFAGDEENVKGAIELDDDAFIIREKGPKVNTYTTQDDSYEAVGTSCPEEVKKILNMAEYNMQGQNDKYLFFQQSPGEIARYLNKLVGLDVIDRAYKKIETKVRDTRAVIREGEARAENHKNDLEKYKGLGIAIQRVAGLEQTAKLYRDREKEQEALESEVRAVKALLEEKDKIDAWLEVESELVMLKNQKAHLWQLSHELKELESDVENVKGCSTKIAASAAWLDIQPVVDHLRKDYETLETYTSELNDLSNIFNKIEETQRHVSFVSSVVDKQTTLYLDTLQRLKICPRCGGPITDEIIERERKRLES
jgi:DNA repair exonuclease SbcCD ATPase subunit